MPKRGRDEGDAKLITSTVKVERIEEEKDRRERDIQIFVQKLEEDGVNPMWVMHFFSHGQNNLELAEEEEGCHWCQIGSWESDKRYPVCIINDVKGDRSRIDPNFRFIEENVVSDGVEFASEEFLSGCDCQEDNDCKKETCGCLQDLEHPEEGSEDTTPYDSNGCLKEWMVESRRPVYECHERCKCSSQCANRVVGQGRQVSLEIFRTDDGRGWGLRSRHNIKKGQFVGKYVGELLAPEVARERRRQAEKAGKKDIYLFAVDKFHDPTSNDPRLRREPYEIDGEYMSGPTRFINHSCDPNLRIFAVVNDHANKPVHELCFFAISDIDRFTELTFDYIDGVDGIKAAGGPKKDSKEKPKESRNLNKCLCGARNCRQFIW